jgi:flagellar transcriptional activator FlhC
MKNRSLLTEAEHIARAGELIRLDARLQVLEASTELSRERLLRLYREIRKKSPSKGMLPYSSDWFMTWQPNMHSSLFMNIYRNLVKGSAIDETEAMIKAYRLYLEHLKTCDLPRVLSITRAWRLIKFHEAGMVTMVACTKCRGSFVRHAHELCDDYVCGLCNPPSRAGAKPGSQSRRGKIAEGSADSGKTSIKGSSLPH